MFWVIVPAAMKLVRSCGSLGVLVADAVWAANLIFWAGLGVNGVGWVELGVNGVMSTTGSVSKGGGPGKV